MIMILCVSNIINKEVERFELMFSIFYQLLTKLENISPRTQMYESVTQVIQSENLFSHDFPT